MIAHPERKIALWHLGVAYTAFLIGTLMGVLQVFIRNDALQLPAWLDITKSLPRTAFCLHLFIRPFSFSPSSSPA